MLKNYFKSAFRNLFKRKSFSFLNIAGLSVGIAAAALIFLWVEDELTYNEYFKDRDHLYQVMTNQTYSADTYTFASTPGPLAPTIKSEIPGVKAAARTTWGDRSLFTKGDKSLYGFGMNVDSPFLSMLNFDFIRGSATNAFSQLHSIVLNEKLALKIFNSTDVVGQTVKLDNKQDYVITGVYKSFPTNTRFESIEWLAPFEIFFLKNEWLKDWGNNGVQTFIQMQPEANVSLIAKQLDSFIVKRGTGFIARPQLLAANDWRLRSEFKDGKPNGGRIRFVSLFSIIAWIILILACINFMNLATARSEQRAREVGVRKVMGSGKGMLVRQFLFESILMSFIAVLFAAGIIALALPYFNTLVEKEISLGFFKPLHLASLIVIGLICGIIAGSYPALYLSSFNPITVLKGLKLPSSFGVSMVRRVLVVSQFVISIALIICTLVIYQQVVHTRNRELGIKKENLLTVNQQLITTQQQGDVGLHFRVFRNDLLATGVVENAALSNNSAFQVGSNSSAFQWRGKEEGKQVLISMDWVTPEIIATKGMKILAGRDFYQDGLADSTNLIINESMARLITKDPSKAVNEIIDRDGTHFTVIGVVKDFIYNNIYGTTAPLVFFNDVNASNTNIINIRFKPDVNFKEGLAKIGNVFKKYNPTYPFEYQFVDDEFDKLFKGESLIGKLAGVFAGLAIFISCLGLFGLAAYTAERRIKEIGIRKVLGASIGQLTAQLSASFLKLVIISCIIAAPIAGWLMYKWLQDYEYHVSLQWWMFVIPALGAVFIAILTVSFQAIRAALMNPVKSLRTE